jgi:predicted ATPase
MRNGANDGFTGHYGKFRVDPKGTFSFFDSITVSGGHQDFILRICRLLSHYIYRFHAERIPSSPCHLGREQTLASDASNLAEVLNRLQGNRAQLDEYNRVVREVLPEICQVNTLQLDDNKGEVIVWNDEKAVSSSHLAFNLTDSGSGVGQVLAILYVVLTAREPQVIILDEPQGFLHPGAVRKLIAVLRRYTKDKHQLIIATHSPTVITASDPISVTMIKQQGPESTFQKIDIKEAAEQRKYLGEVGARLI